MTASVRSRATLDLVAELAPGAGPDELLRRAATVAWSTIIEPGDGAAGLLVRTRGALDALDVLAAGRNGGAAPGGPAAAAVERWRPRAETMRIEQTLRHALGARLGLLLPGDPGWPTGLADLGDHAPLCLWTRGRAEAMDWTRPSVALVGSRAATAYGEHVTAELASELATGGVIVVSGAAYGIDGAAHRAALGAGGATVAFLAGGCDRPYPSGHTALLQRIAQTGLVLSEVAPGSAPTRWRFLARNRLIAAAARATVVVEAGSRSGSLNTAGHAAQLGRALGAVPGPVTSAASVGTHRLLREYGAVCTTNAADVLELIGVDEAVGVGGSVGRSDGHPDADRTDGRSRVLDALSRRTPHDAEEVARRSGMSLQEVDGALGILLIEGEVVAVGDGRWRRV